MNGATCSDSEIENFIYTAIANHPLFAPHAIDTDRNSHSLERKMEVVLESMRSCGYRPITADEYRRLSNRNGHLMKLWLPLKPPRSPTKVSREYSSEYIADDCGMIVDNLSSLSFALSTGSEIHAMTDGEHSSSSASSNCNSSLDCGDRMPTGEGEQEDVFTELETEMWPTVKDRYRDNLASSGYAGSAWR